MRFTKEDMDCLGRLAGFSNGEEYTVYDRAQLGGLVHLMATISHHRTGRSLSSSSVNALVEFNRPDRRQRSTESAEILAETPIHDGQFILVPALFHGACDVDPNDA